MANETAGVGRQREQAQDIRGGQEERVGQELQDKRQAGAPLRVAAAQKVVSRRCTTHGTISRNISQNKIGSGLNSSSCS